MGLEKFIQSIKESVNEARDPSIDKHLKEFPNDKWLGTFPTEKGAKEVASGYSSGKVIILTEPLSVNNVKYPFVVMADKFEVEKRRTEKGAKPKSGKITTVAEAIDFIRAQEDVSWYYAPVPEGAKHIFGDGTEKLYDAVDYGYLLNDEEFIAKVNEYIAEME